ncbi:MAG: hypothetical protein HOY78_16230 [Saccharothrix sp.]|jgi:hypothetical protein|nr:hypothetical protein [Saccharothrix sp.]
MSEPGRVDRFEPLARVKLELDGTIELEQLQDIVARLYKSTGCLSCGRLSFTIEAIDEQQVLPLGRELREAPGVKSITFR